MPTPLITATRQTYSSRRTGRPTLDSIRSYADAAAYLDGASTRSAGNNTRIERDQFDGIHVVLHRTSVICFRSDGSIILDSGGYRTVTTAQRIRACLPPGIRLHTDARGGGWRVDVRGTVLPFRDGIVIEPVNTGDVYLDPTNPRRPFLSAADLED